MSDYRDSQKLTISRGQLNSLLAGIYYRRIAEARNRLNKLHSGASTKSCLVDYSGEPHYRAIRLILKGEDPWDYIQAKNVDGEYLLPFMDAALGKYELFVESDPESIGPSNTWLARRALMLRRKNVQ